MQAQNPIAFQLTEKDGLPDYEIYDVLEDREGYIWIAANKGLYRYDGKIFEHFKHPEKRGLSVFGLTLDDKGRVWCNNISGQFFYVEKDELNLFIDIKENIKAKLPEFTVSKNELIIFTENGVIKISLKSKKKSILNDININSTIYNSPFYFKSTLYFSHGYNLVTIENNFFKHIASFENLILGENFKIAQTKVNDKILFAYSSKKLHFQFYANNKWITVSTPESLKNVHVNNMYFKEDRLWIASTKGVFIYQIIANQLKFESSIIQDQNATNIIQDQYQNYWISTLNSGIYIVPNINITKSSSLDGKKVTDFEYLNEKTLLFGTYDGKVGWLNIETLHTTFFSLENESKVSKVVYDKRRNQVYISQENLGYVWDLETAKIHVAAQLSLAKSMSIQEDILIFGTYNKSVQFALESSKEDHNENRLIIPKFTNQSFKFNETLIRNKRTYTAVSNGNNYWVGYVDGLYFYDSSKQFSSIQYKNKPIFAIDLEVDESDSAWVSTFENGLFQVNKDKIVKSFTSTNGLLSNYLGKIENDDNYLWIITDSGVQRYNKKTNKFYNLLKSDGLETYDYLDIQEVGDYLFLSSSKGISRIHKEKSFKEKSTPNIFLTGIEVNGISIPISNKYELDFNKSSIKISFNVTGFQKETFVDYEYRLLPIQNDWQNVEKGLDFLRYNSLSVGEYIFEIRAKNKNGTASKLKKIALTVNAPFWQKWWFYLIISGLIIAISWLVLIQKSRKKEQEQRLQIQNAKSEQELLFSQLENLRSQMNPHFIFNALNSIQEYIMINDKNLASTYLVKFSRLIRMYLNHSRSQEIALKDEILALQLYLDLEKDRFADTLDFSINIEPNLLNQNFYVPSLFIQPYVENAIKHGLLHKHKDRILKVLFYIQNENLICEVEDNGIGRIEAQKIKYKRQENHQSFATSANEKRVVLLNKMRENKIKVSVEDLYSSLNIASGTKVLIEIPIELYESNNN